MKVSQREGVKLIDVDGEGRGSEISLPIILFIILLAVKVWSVECGLWTNLESV